MDRFVADLRLALRRAIKRPGFTLVALISLTLGIGANTAVFSLADAILLKRTPIPERDRIVEIYEHQNDFPLAPLSYPDYLDLRVAGASTFSQISIAQFAFAPRDMGDHVESLPAELVNGDYFPLLGLRPVIGRLLGPEDDVSAGGHPVVVISYSYWQRAFGGDPAAVGKTVRLSGRPYTIVGIVPKSYAGMMAGISPDLYAPIKMVNQLQPDVRDQLAQRGNHSDFLKARLAPGVSVAQARGLVESYTAEMSRRYPKDWPNGTFLKVIPETNVAVNPMLDGVVIPATAALMVVVGLVLLVACANLASFLLAQARDRRKEIAIRLAIGANRSTLIRQLLAESFLLALVGGVAGALLSGLALQTFMRADLPLPLPITLDISMDWRVFTFALGASSLAGVLFGLLPALQATNPQVIDTIKSENANGGGRGLAMRNVLVVSQVAVSLLLLVTAVLFLRSFRAQALVKPGFGEAPAGMVWTGIPSDRYDATRRRLLLDDIERRMRTLPGVESVGAIDNMLLNSLSQQSKRISVPGVTPPKGRDAFDIDFAIADSGFFPAVGIRVLRGRGFTSTDGPAAPRVALVNEVMAQKFWPGQDAVGLTFHTDSVNYQVVGVVSNTKVRSLGEEPRPFLFTASGQESSATMMLVARTRGDAAQTTIQMLATLREVDPTLMIIQAKTLERHLAVMMLPARLGAMAFAMFGALALALAVLGVYGVVSYAVSRRTREVGIRLAIGAQPAALVKLMMREGLTLVVVGAVIGLALAFAGARILESLLYGVSGSDPLTFTLAPLLLFAAGGVAAYLPARRAGRVDPASVLKAE